MTTYNTAPRILRLKEVITMTGLSRSTIYELMNAKNFPKAVKLGRHSVGWLESEVLEWVKHLLDARDVGVAPF